MLQDLTLTQRVTWPPGLSRTLLRWLERHRYALALILALGSVFVFRMVALRSNLTVSNDAGNYLTTMQQLFGTDVTGEGLRRPPLIGVALWPLVQLFGPVWATKLLAVATSVLIGVPFYLLCSRLTGRAVAVAASIPFVFALRYMSAVGWGFLTLAGVGLYVLCFYLIHEILTAPSLQKRKVVALGLASWALVGTNQVSAVIFVVTALTFGLVALVLGGRPRSGLLRLAPAAALAVLLSLPFVPIYLRQSNAVGHERYFAITDPLQGLANGWDNLRYFFPADPPLLSAAVGLAAIAGAAILLRRSRVGGAILLSLILGPLALNMLTAGSVETRSAYFLYVPVWLGFAACIEAAVQAVRNRGAGRKEGPVWAAALLALVAALTMWSGHFNLLDSADWYGYLGSEQAKAIEVADQQAPPGTGVAYPRTLGRWTEGIAGRRVYESDQRNLFAGAARRSETLVGNALLAGDRVTTNGSAFFADAYVVGDAPLDPVIGVDNGELKHLLFLDDRTIEIEYGAGPALQRVILADAQRQETATAVENGAFVDRRTYHFDGLRVVKEVTLPERGRRVTVVLSVESANGPVSRIVVPVQPALRSWPVSTSSQQALFGFKGSFPFHSGWWTGAFVELIRAEGQEATLTLLTSNEDEAAFPTPDSPGIAVVDSIPKQPGEVIAVAEVKPASSRAQVSLDFTLVGEPAGDEAGLRSFAAEDIIREEEITFALVDRLPRQPQFGDPLGVTTLAWLEQAPYFQLLWEGETVAAYLVAPLAPDEVSVAP